MAVNLSNKELTDRILAVDPKAVVDGLNNAGLSALLNKLSPSASPDEEAEAKRLADAKAKAETDAKKQADANALADSTAKAAEAGRIAHFVAPGKSITTLTGIVDENQPITHRHFHGGREDFDRLLSAGVIVGR